MCARSAQSDAGAAAAEESQRRCIVTGEHGAPETMLRFVLGPENIVVPDLARKLPGRGMWVKCDRVALAEAIKRKSFARAARLAAVVPSDLVQTVETLLLRRTIEALSLARRAGELVMGAGKTADAIDAGSAALVLEAKDGASDGRTKLRRRWAAQRGREPNEIEKAAISALSSDELGLAFGRTHVIHAALFTGRMEKRVRADLVRLGCFGRQDGPNDAGHARHDHSDEGTK